MRTSNNDQLLQLTKDFVRLSRQLQPEIESFCFFELKDITLSDYVPKEKAEDAVLDILQTAATEYRRKTGLVRADPQISEIGTDTLS